MWYNLNPLYYLLGVMVCSGVFILFWDNIRTVGGFAGIAEDGCQTRDELTLAAVREFFDQPEVASLLEKNKNYIGTVVKALDDKGINVTLSVYDTDKDAPVQCVCYQVKHLDGPLQQNFGKSDMIIMG